MTSLIVTYSEYLLLALLLACGVSGPLGATEKPDFVFFIADDHGRMDSGLFEAKDARTPHLDQLARDGMHLSHMFVASPSCAPSRAALFTAQWPQNNGVEANHDYERFAGVTSIVHRFVDLGYEVASFGKVAHGLNNPKETWDHGFTHSGSQKLDFDEVASYLESRDRDKPLLLFVGTRHPHVPWSQENLRFDPQQVLLPARSVDTPQTRLNRAQYLEDVQRMDDHLGATRQLVDRYLGQDTFFLFSSDHGAQWPFGKWNLYEDSVRVATVASWPGRIPAGSESDALLSWIDILPTLLELAGGEAGARRDGRSFAPVLMQGREEHREHVFASHTGDGGDINVYPMRMVRDRDWLYVRNLHPEFRYATHMDKNREKPHNLFWDTWEDAAGKDSSAAATVDAYRRRPAEELFYLPADPHTQRNVAGEPEHGVVLAALRGTVNEYMASTSDRHVVSGTETVLDDPPRSPSGPRFGVGQPEVLLTHEQQLALGIRFIDSGLPMVNADGELKWFATRHDRPGNDEGQMLFEGPRDDPFSKPVSIDIRIEGLPERREEFVKPGNAAWIGNVYRDPASGNILAFLHLEFWPHGMERKKYNRMGLAVSRDGGLHFEWCGYIISPDLPYERWQSHWYPEAPGTNNVGWASYIIRDGWFMVYYQDTEDRPDRAVNGLAVARAPLTEVLQAAAQGRVTPWMKFHRGEFSEPGLGGRFSSLMEPRGYMHGDAAWNEYLQKYMLVVRDGKHRETSGALLISFSTDGLAWSPWEDLRRDEHLHDYPVIVSDGPDNEVTGQSFWIYYKYDPDDVMPDKYGEMRVERVRITLQ